MLGRIRGCGLLPIGFRTHFATAAVEEGLLVRLFIHAWTGYSYRFGRFAADLVGGLLRSISAAFVGSDCGLCSTQEADRPAISGHEMNNHQDC